MKKGIFWCKDFTVDDPELIVVSAECDNSGAAVNQPVFSSKSGENFNHRIEWAFLDKRITAGHPFDYYPRGRVENRNGKTILFLHPDLINDRVLGKITDVFDLSICEKAGNVRIVSDASPHYRYTCEYCQSEGLT